MLQGQRNLQARIPPTLREVWGHASTKNIWILAPKVSFPRFLSHSDRILTDCPNHFLDFNLESLKSFTKKYIHYKKSDRFPYTGGNRYGSAPGFTSYSPLNDVLHSSHALYMLHHRMMLILVFRPSINTSVVVQFLFSSVLNSLSFTSVPKTKGK